MEWTKQVLPLLDRLGTIAWMPIVIAAAAWTALMLFTHQLPAAIPFAEIPGVWRVVVLVALWGVALLQAGIKLGARSTDKKLESDKRAALSRSESEARLRVFRIVNALSHDEALLLCDLAHGPMNIDTAHAAVRSLLKDGLLEVVDEAYIMRFDVLGGSSAPANVRIRRGLIAHVQQALASRGF